MLKLIMAAVLLAAPVAANAAIDEIKPLAAGQYQWDDTGTGRVRIDISISNQKVFVYRDDQLIGVSTVSTGKLDHETPIGSYSILRKSQTYRSKRYKAPMPYMLQFTPDVVALHAGHNPGYPASHGCVRLPLEFAQKLFAVAQVGDEVIVEDDGAMDSIVD